MTESNPKSNPNRKKRSAQKAAETKTRTRASYNVQRLRDLVNETGGKFEDLFSFPEGRTSVRFMPLVEDPNDWVRYRERVWIPAPDGDRRRPFVSVRSQNFHEWCPGYAAYQAIKNKPEYKDIADQIKPQQELLANALVMTAERKWDIKQVKMSAACFRVVAQCQLDLIEDEEEDAEFVPNLGFFDPNHGRIVRVSRKGTGLQTKWNANITDKQLPLKESQMKQRVDFTDLCQPNPIEELEEALCEYLEIGSVQELIGSGAPLSGSDDESVVPPFDANDEDEFDSDPEFDDEDDEEDIP